MSPYKPNPFDFVPFASDPFLKTPEDFDALGEHLTGYLEVRLKALTPVHIVGHQTKKNESSGTSHMYRQNGVACIPAASIRGCLRAFIEALTSGWVSQANLEYPKKYGNDFPNEGRHIGFYAFKEYPPERRQSSGRTSPPAIDKDFEPKIREDHKIDVASYLFGMVLEKRKEVQSRHADLARKSKILIEDAFLPEDALVSGVHWTPDVTGTSFMGGAKPSASTWWYMKPDQVRTRRVRTGGGQILTAEFIGKKFWGRKFYYHQEPEKCVDHYATDWDFGDNSLYTVHLQCQTRNTQTDRFRIYLNRVPRSLVILFVLALQPGGNIRHKLGYGKAYGYGSVEFCIEQAMFRRDDPDSRLPAPLEDMLASGEIQKWVSLAWRKEELTELGLDAWVIDYEALNYLARVLGWNHHERLCFIYPPFQSRFFKQPVTENELNYALYNAGRNKSAIQVAENLFGIKKTIHFRYYQEHAEGWNIISARKP